MSSATHEAFSCVPPEQFLVDLLPRRRPVHCPPQEEEGYGRAQRAEDQVTRLA